MSSYLDVGDVQEGFGTTASPLYHELLKRDTKTVEPALLSKGSYRSPAKPIPAWRYFDAEFAKLEMERVWKKSWQVVGRCEDIPNVGDRKPYAAGNLSYIIIRSGPDSYDALENSCTHRGTSLCQRADSGSSIRCPFHAWEWNLDGSLKKVPSEWDFPGVSDATHRLPQARIESWGGFLFINPDPDAAPLRDALGVLTEHYRPEDAEQRFTLIWLRKKVRANWKVTIEAFLESYHVLKTHPQLLPNFGDASTRYDVWEDGKSSVSRSITPAGVPSPHLGDRASPLLAAQALVRDYDMASPENMPSFSTDEGARAVVADYRRTALGTAFDSDLSLTSDTYMLDGTQYYMFPNFCPWMGGTPTLAYQFTPLGDDPNESVMEIRLLAPIPRSGARPPCAPMIELDFDTPVSSIPDINALSEILDQDFSNSPRVQQGLRARGCRDEPITLGRYQECRIQHLHETLDRRLGL